MQVHYCMDNSENDWSDRKLTNSPSFCHKLPFFRIFQTDFWLFFSCYQSVIPVDFLQKSFVYYLSL